jgi:uncharacterized protein (DUF608 family)
MMTNDPGQQPRGLTRREAVKAIGLATASGLLSSTLARHTLAREVGAVENLPLIPEHKNLPGAWIRSLTDRGAPEVYRGDDLRLIGMPVGGITAGQLYLGGDGRLWHWDIFNQYIHTAEQHYAHPLTPDSPVVQGFSISIDGNWRHLDSRGFSDISFVGQYPIATITYRDTGLAVQLEAFSPYIPLNVDDSGLPATVFRFTLTSSSTAPREIELAGYLQNAICLHSYKPGDGKRLNTSVPIESAAAINFSLAPSPSEPAVDQRADFGTMTLALLETGEADTILADATVDERTGAIKTGGDLLGAVSRKLKLAAGESRTITFALAWSFPNLKLAHVIGGQGRWYANRFKTAGDCIAYLSTNFDRLYRLTKLWRDNWYDSTLPFWFLNRTHLNASILATSTVYRFADGRFYGWEGVGSCPGTCTHVWEYEQAMGRLFPQLDVLLRERADFDPKISFHPDGMIDHRGEFHAGQAVDGQAGIILRCLRDHQTSPDDSFLKQNWASIRKATQWLIARDTHNDGILTGAQHNTLDAEWYGPVAWLSGMYLAALHAAEAMAIDIGDADFAAQCRSIFEKGQKNFVARLFNGEYFINLPDPKRKDAINSGSGCEIDQVLGQSWAWQAGLGRVLPPEQTQSALKSLWKYNFAPDVGPYRAANTPGRWYAMPGEAGLLMCTFPRADWSYEQAKGKGPQWAAGYFNECMNGFEHQVAGHMIWEGMITEGLAVERALHDRYHPSRRNPYNEVECGDHYARSMASYGVFIAACGFEYHGPRARIGFAPRLSPENFKSAFTGAQGWGSYRQVLDSGKLSAVLSVLHGQLSLREISFTHPGTTCRVTGPSGDIAAKLSTSDQKTIVQLIDPLILNEGEKIEITILQT